MNREVYHDDLEKAGWGSAEHRAGGKTGHRFLYKELKGSLTGVKRLVFDFRGLEYISSAGLRVLLAAAQQLGDGEMVVIGANEIVLEVFDVTGFNEIVTIE